MPVYEYHCQTCGNSFEKITTFEARDSAKCPECGADGDRKLSLFSWRWFNPFTKDGEGFSSVKYSPKEADIRAKHSVPKGVSV